MAEVGKALVFYLKYYPEMTRLFEEQGTIPEIEQSADPGLKKKIRDVGDAACVQAAELLRSCISDLEDRLQSTNLVKLKPQRQSTIVNNWGLEIDVWPAGTREPDRVKRQIGIHLQREGLIPWLWGRGGFAAEEKIMNCFATGVECFGSRKHPGWSSGAVTLRTIPVQWEKAADDFTLDADSIIKQAHKVFDDVNPVFIKKFIAPF